MATLAPLLLLVFAGLARIGRAAPEQGVWDYGVVAEDMKTDKDRTTRHTFFTYKSMFNNSHVGLSIDCQGSDVVPVTIYWVVRESPCANEFLTISKETDAELYLNSAETKQSLNDHMPYKSAKFVTSTLRINCTKHQHVVVHPYIYTSPEIVYAVTPAPAVNTKPPGEDKGVKESPDQSSAGQKQAEGKQQSDNKSKVRRRREAAVPPKDDPQKQNKTEVVKPEKIKTEVVVHEETDQNGQLVRVWEDGYYLFVLQVVADTPPVGNDFKMHVTVKMSYGKSYLSAVDWPLLVFYGVMGLVYIFFGVFWLLMLACNWRDLLRVQFWIGAVIFLGMLEMAVFFGEYENINKTGQSVKGAIIVAELVSCLKRTLARMLVLIVSLGYGIVKPRLGQTFHKVLFVGVVFFILASIESCSRALSGRAEQSVKLLVASVPLAVTDAIICWWIFSSLLQTTRTLRLRRNVVKLSLYRHFTNTLIFSVIASVAYMIWFMTQHRLKECLTDWRELWIDDAFWQLLFSVILFVIMILWRPSVNNQRYAFSPLLDAAEDDLDDEQALSDAYEGMKMRSTNSQQRNGSPRVKDDQKGEDDLKWVEDNIPTSLADKILPALDSDEEIMNTKFEVSKME
ncbi:hypothetical protein BsWGS_15483 [Bradybaena similaris]